MIGIAESNTLSSAAELIRLAAEGDHAAFASIVRTHHLELVRVGFVISGNADTADQAAAAAWVVCWKQLRGLRDPDRLRSWLCAITANEARQLVRKQRRRSLVEIRVDTAVSPGSGDPAARPGDLDLANALARLSPEDRALVALRYVAGLNSTELGQAMGCRHRGRAPDSRGCSIGCERSWAMSDLPMSDFERSLERRVRAYAATHDPVVDADRIAYQAEDAAQATPRRWLGRGAARLPAVGGASAGVWVPVLLGLLLLLGGAVFAAGVLLTLSDRTPIAANGLIAYGLGREFPGSGGRIHVVNADGSGDHDAGPGSCPRYLADGSAMTYVSGWDPSGTVPQTVFAEPDGSGVRDVGPFLGAAMAFSPDGLQFAQVEHAASSGSFELEIWLTTVSDGSRRLLVPADAVGDLAQGTSSGLTWSPDGSSIALAVMERVNTAGSSGQYRRQIAVVDVEMGLVTVVSERPGTDYVGIAWSPDSRSLAYLGLPDDSPLPLLPAPGSPLDQWNLLDVFVARLDGTGDRNITSDEAFDFAPAWSPDGSAISYLSGDAPALRVAEVDGVDGTINRFTGPTTRSYVWSPDGTVILYAFTERDPVTGQPIRSTISAVDPRFANPPRTVVETEETITCLSWQAIWP